MLDEASILRVKQDTLWDMRASKKQKWFTDHQWSMFCLIINAIIGAAIIACAFVAFLVVQFLFMLFILEPVIDLLVAMNK
jgi:hypothetical protein